MAREQAHQAGPFAPLPVGHVGGAEAGRAGRPQGRRNQGQPPRRHEGGICRASQAGDAGDERQDKPQRRSDPTRDEGAEKRPEQDPTGFLAFGQAARNRARLERVAYDLVRHLAVHLHAEGRLLGAAAERRIEEILHGLGHDPDKHDLALDQPGRKLAVQKLAQADRRKARRTVFVVEQVLVAPGIGTDIATVAGLEWRYGRRADLHVAGVGFAGFRGHIPGR